MSYRIMPHRWVVPLVVVLAGMAGEPMARAGEGCCQCGAASCHKVCRLICEQKTIEVPCFCSRSETVCKGGPCRKGCRQCESVCRECGQAGCTECCGAARGKRFVYQQTIPGCPKQYRRKVLLMKKEKKKVTVYRWVVEDVCNACESKLVPPVVPKSAAIPAPPKLSGVVVQSPQRVSVRVTDAKDSK